MFQQIRLTGKGHPMPDAHDNSHPASSTVPAAGPTWRRGDWMQTYTGRQFFPMDPRPEDIATADIARSLSMQCRYNGHTTRAYSVAEHSVLISRAVCPEHALAGLLHDATEAYLGDMVKPLKRHMGQYVQIEQNLWQVIAGVYGVPVELPTCVTQADTRILIDERAALLGPSPAPWGTEHLEPLGVSILALPQQQAEALWLGQLDYLT